MSATCRKASMGHVRDLPKGKLGVDVDNDFAPTYQAITDRKDVLKRLTAANRLLTLARNGDVAILRLRFRLRDSR